MSLSSFASAVLRGMIQTAIPLRTHFALKVIGAIALWVVGLALISTEVEARLSELACSRAEAAVQPANPCRPPQEFAIGSAQRPEDRLWPDQGRRVRAFPGETVALTPTRRHWTSVPWTSVPHGRRYEAVGQLVIAASPTPGEFASVRPHP
jgi:hypothetical protein